MSNTCNKQTIELNLTETKEGGDVYTLSVPGSAALHEGKGSWSVCRGYLGQEAALWLATTDAMATCTCA